MVPVPVREDYALYRRAAQGFPGRKLRPDLIIFAVGRVDEGGLTITKDQIDVGRVNADEGALADGDAVYACRYLLRRDFRTSA